MDIRLATEDDKVPWDKFVASNGCGSFMQSWGWGDVQQKFGTSIWRVVADQDGDICGVALILKREMPMGRSYLYIPRGPVTEFQISNFKFQMWQEFIVNLAHKEKAVFVRIDPLWKQDDELDMSNWRKAEHEVQPKDTLVVDLKMSEDDLLAEMHQKTRYNIRLAERKGVEIRFSRNVKDLDSFLELAREVSARGEFRYHPDLYYRAMHSVLASLELAVAEHEGNVLAVHLLVSFGDWTTYVHGASSNSSRDLMGPHLLQWETIRRAKAQGKSTYDFFGVTPADAKSHHAWAGIARFKEGFGGRRVSYIGAHDLVLDRSWYAMFTMARRIRHLGIVRK